jgi:hypothetical protein
VTVFSQIDGLCSFWIGLPTSTPPLLHYLLNKEDSVLHTHTHTHTHIISPPLRIMWWLLSPTFLFTHKSLQQSCCFSALTFYFLLLFPLTTLLQNPGFPSSTLVRFLPQDIYTCLSGTLFSQMSTWLLLYCLKFFCLNVRKPFSNYTTENSNTLVLFFLFIFILL